VTPHSQLTTALRDRINSYALGLLDTRDSLRFERHLRQPCAVCEKELHDVLGVVANLALTVPQLTPPPSVRERLMDSVRSIPETRYVIRADDATWQPAGVPGVTVKQLSIDAAADRVTMLVRMEPGAVYPAHRHHGAEQCLVLEGDLTNNVTLRAGDYSFQPAHTEHPVSRTENGCLLLIIASNRDELLT
jgi:anti-sigma factor ChrR (cupin superfamily)